MAWIVQHITNSTRICWLNHGFGHRPCNPRSNALWMAWSTGCLGQATQLHTSGSQHTAWRRLDTPWKPSTKAPICSSHNLSISFRFLSNCGDKMCVFSRALLLIRPIWLGKQMLQKLTDQAFWVDRRRINRRNNSGGPTSTQQDWCVQYKIRKGAVLQVKMYIEAAFHLPASFD